MSNIGLISRLVSAWNAQDTERVRAIFSQNATYVGPKGQECLADPVTQLEKCNAGRRAVWSVKAISESKEGSVRLDRGELISCGPVGVAYRIKSSIEIDDGRIREWRDEESCAEFMPAVSHGPVGIDDDLMMLRDLMMIRSLAL